MTPKTDGVAAGTGLAAFGAASSSLAASLCCTAPAVLALTGTAGFMFAAALEPYRLYLVAGSFALLTVGFWRSYVAVPESGACPSMIGKVARLVLWLSLVMAIAAAIVPFWIV